MVMERTDVFLNTEWRGSRSPWIDARAGPFVTISREAGSGGTSLARILARKLNGSAPSGVAWTVFEGNVTSSMLQEHHLPARLARYLPEDHVSEINAYVGELVGLHPSLWDLVQKTNETMCRLARRGHVVLVGRGANFATKAVEGGVHVRLVAPVKHRAHYLAQLYDISETEAEARNARCDAARRRYVKDTFDADIADLSAYDLVINTARMTLTQAGDLVATQVQAKIRVA